MKFASGNADAIGNWNKSLNVYEYVCFSIWRNGGADLRYARLKDTVIPIPPVSSDTRFRTSHSAKSVYYLGVEIVNEKEKLVLVVISLKNLSYKTYDLSQTGEDLKNLRDSSLIMNDTALCYKRTVLVPGKHHAKE